MRRVIFRLALITVLSAQDVTSNSHLVLLRAPDTIEKSVESAGKPPKPAWQARLSVQETDFIEFVSKDHVLIGTIDIHDMGGGLKPHELIMLNSTTGEALWTAPRQEYGPSQTLLAYSPVILLQGSKQTAALNSQTGAQIWSREQAGASSLLLADLDLIVFLKQKSSPLSLSALDVKTGKEIWSASVENYPVEKGKPIELISMGDNLLLNGPEAVAFSALDGKLLWREQLAATFGPKAAAVPLGSDIYFSDGSEVCKADAASGKVIWRAPIMNGEFETLTAIERKILVLVKGGGVDATDSIAALDGATGKQIWQSDLVDRAASPIHAEGDTLYITTPRNLIAMKALDGSILFNTPIPSGLESNRLLPDNLDFTDGRVIVARENGVLAVRKSDGKLLYADAVEGGQGFTYDFETARFRHASLNSVRRNKKHPVELNPQSATPDLNFHVAMAQQRSVYREVLSRQAFAMQNVSAQIHQTFQPRTNSFTGQPVQRTPQQARAAANHELQAQLAVTGALTVLTMLGEKSFERTVSSYQERVRHTFDTHANSLQGKFYLRPSYRQNQGWSLHVVNLETGEHANVLLSSDEDLQPDAMTPNLAAFSTDGARIVTKGLGSNPEIPEEKKGHSWTPKLRIVTKRPKVSYPSILTFDIASLRFEPASNTDHLQVEPAKNTLDEQLLEAAYQDNVQAAKKALDAGANINATDEYGDTALMLAAEAATGGKKSELIKLLLARGADPNLRDPVGLTAREHSELLLGENDYGLTKAGDSIEKAQKANK